MMDQGSGERDRSRVRAVAEVRAVESGAGGAAEAGADTDVLDGGE